MGAGYMPNGGFICDGEDGAPSPADAIGMVHAARARLVAQLADEIAPLLDRPYAFLGFSLGAMLAYLLCLELRSRGHALPTALIVSGRGAPHDTQFPHAHIIHLLGSDDDAVIDAAPVDIRGMTANFEERKPAVSARWRLGSLFATLRVSESDEKGRPTMLPTDASEAAGAASVNRAWPRPMAALSTEPLACTLVTIWSAADELWSPGDAVLARWEDVVTATTEPALGSSSPGKLSGNGNAESGESGGSGGSGGGSSGDASGGWSGDASGVSDGDHATAGDPSSASDHAGTNATSVGAQLRVYPGGRCDYQLLSGLSHFEMVQHEHMRETVFAALAEATAAIVTSG